MNAQLTLDEIKSARELLKEYQPANKAIDAVERHNGNLDRSFEELWIEKNGNPTMGGKKIWQTTLDVLRDELCSNEGFRARLSDYTKSPENAVLLTAAITSLMALTAIPLDPSIATIIVLYILKIGLNVSCKYTDGGDGGTLPPGK
ncbi:hypothetical protein VF14_12495 [Nostoc linckia z18]|uniref:Uncharacterized protein n=2 Tax=Nostoc linckia TaxID=92942 RepID=A0A9Q6EJ76_NOSLI|nr:hypothetical protein [Nostoc linckia]PHK39525.1 hypothetical protein VF12_13895 [Nostoc linckia z15]PHK46351.1 hypothetical protein VF13_11055 [Nostoc linckia z16]PHJ63569.1 hypothetical protein VF05_24175 [Nostoc linckia z3]PHJ65504.1 hypothetical protein VF02_10475 [Nostoc linckia z1]PHJ76987.1 hypothetical protein VF03_05815 [Nostoc linckia z2]